MLIAGIDFETTGLDSAKDRVIEIGAVLWDTERACPVQILSVLCVDEGIPNPLPPDIEQITGLTHDMLTKFGCQSGESFLSLFHLVMPAEAIVAHNAPFDKGFYDAELARIGRELPRPWVDTVTDIKYPPRVTTRKLSHLAAEHGFVNPFQHRAVFDVFTMLRILNSYNLAEILEYAKQPIVTLQALVSFDDREKAKARGYRWAPETKQWIRSMRLPDVAIEEAEAEFAVRQIA